MSRVLIDTSVLIDFLRQERKEETIFDALVMSGRYEGMIAMITMAELYAGESVWRGIKARVEVEELLTGLQVAPLTPAIAEQAGKLRATQQVPILDALIAATAIDNNVPILTFNVSDFKKIKGLKLFSLG